MAAFLALGGSFLAHHRCTNAENSDEDQSLLSQDNVLPTYNNH
jgi:hypothetical protein